MFFCVSVNVSNFVYFVGFSFLLKLFTLFCVLFTYNNSFTSFQTFVEHRYRYTHVCIYVYIYLYIYKGLLL